MHIYKSLKILIKMNAFLPNISKSMIQFHIGILIFNKKSVEENVEMVNGYFENLGKAMLIFRF